MSSPAPRRSRPASVQGTPQNTRQNVQSSSPLFYQSSPAAPNGNPNGNGAGNVDMDISSPLKQVSVAGSTPRAPPGGKSKPCKSPQLLIPQIHPQSATHHRPVQRERAPMETNNLIYLQVAAVYLSGLQDHLHPARPGSIIRGEETSIPTSLAQRLGAGADCSSTRTAYPYEMGVPPTRQPFPISILIHQKPMPSEAPLRELFGGRISPSRIRCLHSRSFSWVTRRSTACGPTVLQRKRLRSPGAEGMKESMSRC